MLSHCIWDMSLVSNDKQQHQVPTVVVIVLQHWPNADLLVPTQPQAWFWKDLLCLFPLQVWIPHSLPSLNFTPALLILIPWFNSGWELHKLGTFAGLLSFATTSVDIVSCQARPALVFPTILGISSLMKIIANSSSQASYYHPNPSLRKSQLLKKWNWKPWSERNTPQSLKKKSKIQLLRQPSKPHSHTTRRSKHNWRSALHLTLTRNIGHWNETNIKAKQS